MNRFNEFECLALLDGCQPEVWLGVTDTWRGKSGYISRDTKEQIKLNMQLFIVEHEVNGHLYKIIHSGINIKRFNLNDEIINITPPLMPIL